MTIDLENGEGDEKPEARRGPGRPKKTEQTGDLQRSMKEQLEELAEWIRRRDPELAETFLEDVPRMAKFLATRASKHAALARGLKVVFAPDGPLAALRAFGRTIRVVGARIGARRDRDDEPLMDEHGRPIDEHGNLVDAQP